MSTQTYTLKHPVAIKNKEDVVIETITTVTIKRPKGREFRAMKSEGKVGMTMDLLSACANLPPSTVDLIDGEDLVPLMEIVGGFFGGLDLTGAKP